jgi:hypothetical protein
MYIFMAHVEDVNCNVCENIEQKCVDVCLCKLLCKKGIAIPLHAWTGPEGSRRLRLPDFQTVGT